jgi:hypothetical protein
MTITTPEAVERFDLEQPTEHMGSASMDRAPGYGDWVRYSDYVALSAALEAERASHTATLKDAQDECARAEKAEAEVARLRDALFECQEEIDAYIQHEYPHDHPVQERYRQRDYAANPARIALQKENKP